MNEEILITESVEDTPSIDVSSQIVIPEFMNEAPMSDVAQNRMAASMALAALRNGPADKTFAQHYEEMKGRLATEGPEPFRNELGLKDSMVQAFKDRTEPKVNRYALEEQSVDQAAEMAVMDDEAFRAQMKEDWDELVRDRAIKRQIVQNEIDRIQTRIQSDSKLRTLANYIAVAVPFNMSVREVGEFAPLNSGERLREKRARLFDLPLDQFKQEFQEYVKFLEREGPFFEDNPVLNKQALETLLDFGAEDVQSHTFWTWFDAADVALTPVSMGVSAASRAMRKAIATSDNVLVGLSDVNRGMAVDTAVDRVLAAQSDLPDTNSIVTTKNSIDQMLPSYVSGTMNPSVGLSGDILRSVEATQQALADTLKAKGLNSRLTDDELNAAFVAAKEGYEKRFKPNELKDVKIHGVDEVTGLIKISTILGKADGRGGYASKRSAERAMVNRGLSNANVIQNDDGLYYIQQIHNMREEGFVLGTDPNSIKGWGYITTVLNPHTWINKRTSVMQQVASGQKDRITAAINEQIFHKINKINVRERGDLNAVMAKGLEEEKWYNLSELRDTYTRYRGTPPTDREVEAYYTMKTLNDFDWSIRNAQIYTDKARRGHEQITIPAISYEGSGKVITKYKDLERFRVMDASTGRLYAKGEIDAPTFDEMIKEGKYKLISLDEPIFAKGDIPIKLVLTKAGDAQVGPLNPVQLSYRSGGHRMYAPNQKFVKQAFIGEAEDGSKFMLDPIVHTAGESAEQVTAWANRMETARLSVLEYKAGRMSEEDVLDALQDANIRDLEHWDELVDNKQIRENTPFEVVDDGQNPLFGANEAMSFEDMRDVSFWMDDLSRYASHSNKPYVGRRGDRLVGPDDELVKIMDPFETANRAIENAVRTGAYYDYRTTQIESWAAAAAPFMRKDAKAVSPSELFEKPESYWLPKIDQGPIDKLLASRRQIQRQLGYATKFDRSFESMKSNLASWMEGRSGGTVNQATFKEALDVASTNVVQRIRSLTYDLYLGLLNPAQVLVQVQTSAAMAVISPRNGAKAILNYPVMRAMWNQSDEAIDRMVKESKSIFSASDLDADDFALMMKELNRSGFNRVDEGYSLLGDVTPRLPEQGVRADMSTMRGQMAAAATMGDAGRTTSAFRRGTRFFLTGAERFNTGVAWGTAWREFKERFPKQSPSSDAGRQWILDRANALNMDMRNHAKSALQEGVQAIPAQFAQYQIHLLQNVFGKNSRFSVQEQERLFIGLVAMYGTGGALSSDMAEGLREYYHELTGEPMPVEGAKVIQSGIFDAALYSISGGKLNTDFGSRAGVGGWIDQMGTMWSEKSILEMAAGPGGTAIGGLAGAIGRNVKMMANHVVHENLTSEDARIALMDIARSASSVSTAEKAYIMATTGIGLAKSGMFEGNGRNELEAMATIMGIPLAEVTNRWRLHEEYVVDRNKIVADTAKQITYNFTRMSLEEDEKVMEAWGKRSQVMLKALNDPLLEKEVLDKVSQMLKMTPDAYERIGAKAYIINQTEPLANELIQVTKKRNEGNDNNGVQ